MTQTAKHAFVYERNRVHAIADNDPLLTTTQVAKHLNCSRSMVYKLTYQGDLRYLRLGRALRVPASALKAYMRKRQMEFDQEWAAPLDP